MSIAFADVEKLAFELPKDQRAKLADSLLRSLPEGVFDEEEIAEAIRRDREMDEHPERSLSLEELDQLMAAHLAR